MHTRRFIYNIVIIYWITILFIGTDKSFWRLQQPMKQPLYWPVSFTTQLYIGYNFSLVVSAFLCGRYHAYEYVFKDMYCFCSFDYCLCHLISENWQLILYMYIRLNKYNYYWANYAFSYLVTCCDILVTLLTVVDSHLCKHHFSVLVFYSKLINNFIEREILWKLFLNVENSQIN